LPALTTKAPPRKAGLVNVVYSEPATRPDRRSTAAVGTWPSVSVARAGNPGGENTADDPRKTGKADRDRINVHQDHELRDWSKSLGVSPERLKEAVAKVGPMVSDVRRELGKT
jgi:hypothetical protein